MAAVEVPANLQLTAVDGQTRTMDEWLITFQMLGVVLDPFTYESSWILETAGRVLENYRGASVRTCFIVTGTVEEAKQFCGPWVDRVLVYADPDRAFVKAAELEALPALFHLRQNRQFGGIAQGWQPEDWRALTHQVARERRWSHPVIPAAGDPAAYQGSPALGSSSEPGRTELPHRPQRAPGRSPGPSPAQMALRASTTPRQRSGSLL